MKKIVLGCAAVLLSLGLLAGCNNEEKAVSITVDSAATVIVGETLELPYTVDPEKAEVVAESSNDSVLEAVAQEGILYLEGIAEGSASVTLMGTYKKYTDAFASVSVTVATKATEDTEPGPDTGDDGGDEGGDTGTTGPGEQVITLTGVPETLDLVLEGEPGTITPVATPEGAVIEYAIDDDTIVSLTNTATLEGEYEFTVTPLVVGTTNIVFTASLAGYEDVTATTAVTVHETGWEPEPEPEPGETAPYTIRFKLTNSKGESLAITEGINCYAVGDLWTDTNENGDVWWDIRPEEQILVENEIDGTTYYDVVIEDYTEVPTLGTWGGKIELIAYNNNETLDWDTYYANVVYTDNIESGLTPSANGVYEINAQLEFESWEEHFDHSNDTSFYILVVNSADSPVAWTIGRIKCQTTGWADYYAFNGENICNATTGTTTGGTYYFCNSVAGTAQPGTELYFYCSVTDDDWSVEVDTNSNSTITVPETDGDNVAIWVSGAEYTSGKTGKINSTADSLGGSRGTGGWITDYASIDEYLAAISW